VVGIIVFIAVAYVVVKFRQRPGHDDVPRQIHGAPKLEVTWTIIPALILAVVAVPTIKTVFDLAKEPENSLEINVVGQQWWWEFQYPGQAGPNGPIVTANEMVIPAGVRVKLSMTSRDVIHSFWIPRLNGKRDVVPGRIQSWWLEADEPGEFLGQCTEFCGLSHANMRMRVVALSPPDFQRWVTNQELPAAPAPAGAAEAGQTVFAGQCARCHTINGLKDANGQLLVSQADQQLVSGAAPNLTHLMSRTIFASGVLPLKLPNCTGDVGPSVTGTPTNCLNTVQLSQWLRNAPGVIPMAVIPNSQGLIQGMPNLNLSEQQISDLVAYLSTLK
jgi:cytochrome c oxidase subunit 2